MTDNKMTAEHLDMGIWEFKCFAHDPPYRAQEISSPEQAVKFMKTHCNNEHRNVIMWLRRESQYSGTWRSRYRAPEAGGVYPGKGAGNGPSG